MKHTIITIDGPSGTGKSTVARAVAARLGFVFLDTGALYRTAALAVKQRGGDFEDDAACADIVRSAHIVFNGESVSLDGCDVSQAIRTHEISHLSSMVARHPAVRRELLALQRGLALSSPVVAEGRDTGSVVFPDADLKFYLDATPLERAQRRQHDLKQQGVEMPLERVLVDIEKRDQRDRSREESPLIVPQHAIVVDTTHLSLEGTIGYLIDKIQGSSADQ